MKKTTRFYKNKWVIAGVIVLIIIVGLVAVNSKKGVAKLETTLATTQTVTETVSVTGKVTPFKKADLGFEKGGTVTAVNYSVGDHVRQGAVIASVNDAQTYASLLGAQASLQAAQADLADNQTNTDISYKNAQKTAVDSGRDAYVKASDVVLNQLDTFFRNGPSVNPTFLLNADTYAEERSIENQRAQVTIALEKWKAEIDAGISSSDAVTFISDSQNYLTTIKNFVSVISARVTNLTRNGSSLPQATINSYLETMSTANTGIGNALTALTTARNNLTSTTPKSTLALQARIAQASADVANFRAQYAKSQVTAPFDGIMTRIDPAQGDIVTAGQSQFGIMADQSFKVEVNVPEADIAKVAVGNKAKITLDAYGSDVTFSASVISIDPAETVVEGVPTYKVTLQFDTRDDRVRSGMTANIDIITAEKPNVVAIPFRAVIDNDGKKTVRVVNADKKTFTEVPVTVGLKGADGMVEIQTGLASSTEVVTYTQ